MDADEDDADSQNKPFIIGINASPRHRGEGVTNLKRTLRFVEKYGGKTQLVHLIDLNIAVCEGCYSDSPKKCTYPCRHTDDTRWLHELLLKADGFILATPVNWFLPHALAVTFVSKLTALENNGNLLKGKVAGIIVDCGMYGAAGVAEKLLLDFQYMRLKVPYPAPILCNMISNTINKSAMANKMLKGADRVLHTELARDGWWIKDFEELAYNMVEEARKSYDKSV